MGDILPGRRFGSFEDVSPPLRNSRHPFCPKVGWWRVCHILHDCQSATGHFARSSAP